MTSSVLAVVVDCIDAHTVARFWADALDCQVIERNPREYRVGEPSSGATVLYFMDVPEPKSSKNRLHVDVITDGSLEREVERLCDLGATVVAYREDSQTLSSPDRWAVLTDPEGNEFCVTSTSTLSDWYE